MPSIRIFASIIIGLSGLVLYLDKLCHNIGFQFDIPAKFAENGMGFETFVWLWAQTLSPILIIIGTFFNPYRYVYSVPLFCYLIQVYTLAFDSQDFTYAGIYSFVIVVSVFTSIELIKRYLNRTLKKEIEIAKNEISQKVKDVQK